MAVFRPGDFTPELGLRCYSLAPYPSKKVAKPGDEMDAAYQRLTYAVKDDKQFRDHRGVWGNPYVAVAEHVDRKQPSLAPIQTFIPIPGHRVTNVTTLCASHNIANALRAKGFGARVLNALLRGVEVKHSTRAKEQKDRPTVQEHRDSLTVDPSVRDLIAITLVDDTLTSGTQLIGAYLALKAAGFNGAIEAFTVAHTLGGPTSERKEHHVGTIDWYSGHSYATRVSV